MNANKGKAEREEKAGKVNALGRPPKPDLVDERTGLYRPRALGLLTVPVNLMARIGRFMLTMGGLRHHY